MGAAGIEPALPRADSCGHRLSVAVISGQKRRETRGEADGQGRPPTVIVGHGRTPVKAANCHEIATRPRRELPRIATRPEQHVPGAPAPVTESGRRPEEGRDVVLTTPGFCCGREGSVGCLTPTA